MRQLHDCSCLFSFQPYGWDHEGFQDLHLKGNYQGDRHGVGKPKGLGSEVFLISISYSAIRTSMNAFNGHAVQERAIAEFERMRGNVNPRMARVS